MNLLAHQIDALDSVRNAFDRHGAKSVLVEMCCGSGKSLIMRRLADEVPFVVFVFPSLALIAQFFARYLDVPHLVVSSEGSTDPADVVSYLSTQREQHVVCVTYNSLDVLIANLRGRRIERGIFDEAHHVGSPTYSAMIVGRDDIFAQQVHLTATPREGVEYGERVFHFPYSKALELEMVRKFRIRVCVRPRGADGVSLKDYHTLLADTARKTGHTKALVFSSNVAQMVDDDITCVDYFTNREMMREVLSEMGWEMALEMNKITAATSATERDAMLARFGIADDIFRILCSCRTLGEGIDTCLANLAMFADKKTTWEAIVQAIGRVTRRNRAIAFEDDEATALIPVFVDAEKYAACTTAEEMDKVLRENIGDFETLRNFLAALEQSDPDLADQIINSRWTPKEVKENAKKQGWEVGEEMSLQEALCELLETDEIDEEPDLDEVATEHEVCIVVHTDLMEAPERYHGNGEMVRLLELRDGEAYCTLTKKERVEKDDLEAPEKAKVVKFDSPLQWSLEGNDMGSAVMKYMVKVEPYEERIRQLHEFHAMHGVPRHGGKRENEKYLANWISRRSGDNRSGRNVALCNRLRREFPWIVWEIKVRRRPDVAIKMMHDFCQKYGDLPKQLGKRENEIYLAAWIRERRDDYKKGKNAALCETCEREFHGWIWDASLKIDLDYWLPRIRQFYASYGEPPREGGKRPDEHELAKWIGNRRTDKKKGKNLDICERLQQEFLWWSWDSLLAIHQNAVKKLELFHSKYGVPKQDGIREDEAYLALWMVQRRKDKKKGLNSELCDQIEAKFLWWQWDPKKEHVDRMFDMMHTFYKVNGIPIDGGEKKNEKKLHSWITSRLGDKRNGKNVDICNRIDAEFEWWVWDSRGDNDNFFFQKLVDFHEKHKEMPIQRGNREFETKIASWITNVKISKKKGSRLPLVEAIEKRFPGSLEKKRSGPRLGSKRKSPAKTTPESKRPKTYASPIITAAELRALRDPTPPCDIATDFRDMTMQQWHQKAFTMRSATLGAIFQAQPEAWHAYHSGRHLDYDPLDRVIEEMKKARHLGVKQVADLGCGTAKLARHFHDIGDQRFNIRGFDHVAIPEWSTACDIAACESLLDDSFNIVVLCLGLWGTNKADTLRSAFRILETNGVLYLVEPTRRWTPAPTMDEPEPAKELIQLLTATGFVVLTAEIKQEDRILKFSFFKCVKP